MNRPLKVEMRDRGFGPVRCINNMLFSGTRAIGGFVVEGDADLVMRAVNQAYSATPEEERNNLEAALTERVDELRDENDELKDKLKRLRILVTAFATQCDEATRNSFVEEIYDILDN